MQSKFRFSARTENRWYTIALCAGGLAINFILAHLVKLLHLPMYWDIVGTALTAALGGYIPGIIVGFLTNIINAFGDPETIYYGSVSVLIAVTSAYFASEGYYEKPAKYPFIIAAFALIGGALGSVLTFALYGLDFGTGVSAPLAHYIYDNLHWGVFSSQFTADIAIDLADKTFAVLVVALVWRLMPGAVKEKFNYSTWHQTPLSRQSQYEADHRGTRRMSLRTKIIFLVVTGMIITALVVTGISYVYFTQATINDEEELAWSVARVMLKSFDHDRVDEYIQQGEAAEGYLESETILKNLMDSSPSIEFCYVYRIEPDGCHVVFDPDTADMPGADPGEIVPFDEAFGAYLPKLLAGETIPSVISNESYGWLLSIYQPVYDSKGVCQCYACVDIKMTDIVGQGLQFLARVVSLFFGFFVLILTVAVWLAEYNIILPINTMAMTTDQFAFDSPTARTGALEKIQTLNIYTGDEIENLYKAVVKTTEDMVQYIVRMQRQNEQIRKLQNGLIMVLADMVESRDQCTGDHVRKTAAYTDIIMRQLRKDGLYLNQLTDEFMEDVVNSAPLHDVGKIQVPDAILNKPGKLTPEEFEIMKTHTTAGSDIIARAMSMVSQEDSGYLREAQNLAHYHHEKWNGMGYPCGLKGEEIPLSARIMAVADVFDALVSRRPYKEGFPFEKAMAIIREGAGSHFDPSVAEAFERSSEEVHRVMNTYMGE